MRVLLCLVVLGLMATLVVPKEREVAILPIPMSGGAASVSLAW